MQKEELQSEPNRDGRDADGSNITFYCIASSASRKERASAGVRDTKVPDAGLRVVRARNPGKWKSAVGKL